MQAFMHSLRLRPSRMSGYLCPHEQDRRFADEAEGFEPQHDVRSSRPNSHVTECHGPLWCRQGW